MQSVTVATNHNEMHTVCAVVITALLLMSDCTCHPLMYACQYVEDVFPHIDRNRIKSSAVITDFNLKLGI